MLAHDRPKAEVGDADWHLEQKPSSDLGPFTPHGRGRLSSLLAQQALEGGTSALYTLSSHHDSNGRKISTFARGEEPPEGICVADVDQGVGNAVEHDSGSGAHASLMASALALIW